MDQQQRETNTGYEKLGTQDTRKDHAETINCDRTVETMEFNSLYLLTHYQNCV